MSDSAPLRHLFLIHAAQGTERAEGREAVELLDSVSFEQQLLGLWESGRAAWPGVILPASRFIRHLAARLPEGELVPDCLATVHAADLYLACACLDRVPAALVAFEHKLLVLVPRYIGRIDSAPVFVDEVCQRLREKLFVAAQDAAPKIADYSGWGPLAIWLRVVACRIALSLKRQRSDVPLDDAPIEQAPARRNDVELDYLRDRYKDEFRAALREAIAALPSDRRDVLRLYFISGLSLEKIGAHFRVHQSTVTRWIAAARSAILLTTRRLIGERLHLSPTEFDSLAGLLRSELDLSLSRLLEPSASPPRGP